jgi:hypothetical protein
MSSDVRTLTMGMEYVAFRSDPANDDTTDAQWCVLRGYVLQDLYSWKSKASWAKLVLDKRREKYSEQMSEVDRALIEKAKGGDTKAAALLYARFEGWTPRTMETEAKKGGGKAKTLAELIEEGA